MCGIEANQLICSAFLFGSEILVRHLLDAASSNRACTLREALVNKPKVKV